MFDIGTIREQLNERAFESGSRAVCLGAVSELFPDNSPIEVEVELQRLGEQLGNRDLILERGREEPEKLYVVQKLKCREIDLTWMANGMQWVAKITTVALEMVVPGVIGMWLDQRLETQFLGLLGIILGVPLGIWHLMKMTKR